jgi:hypothetical protein
MFGQVKPVVFDRYSRQRASWRPPRWLVLLLLGAAAGAGGVLYVQQRVLPPRLSVEDSQRLQTEFDRADTERTKLQRELATLKRQFEVATAESRRRDEELLAARTAVERQRGEIAVLVSALPPDPRGGDVEVRSARFSASGGTLSYDLVLTRKGASRPMEGQLQFTVAGVTGGRETTLPLKPVTVSLGAHQVLRGQIALPADFAPRQTTVQVTDRAARPLGMRVLRVESP